MESLKRMTEEMWDDCSDIESKVAALKEAVNKGDTALMKTGMEELQKALYAASEKLYKNAAPQDGQAPQGGQPGAGQAPNGGHVYDAEYKDVDDNK